MITTFLLCFIFLGPGFLISVFLCIERLRLFHALLYSYASYLVSFWFVATIGWPEELVVNIQIGQAVALFGILFLKGRVRVLASNLIGQLKGSGRHGIPEIIIVTMVSIWLFSVGPYLEIPTDVFEHLTRITDIKQDLKHGAFGTTFPWYSAVAIALRYSGEPVSQIIMPFSVAMTAIFLFGVISLARELAGQLKLSRLGELVLLISSPVCTLLMFGTSVFSYLRYYIFAPTFLVYLIYLFSGFLAIDLIVNERLHRKFFIRAITVFLGILVSYVVHRQEALFIVSMLIAGVAYVVLTDVWRVKKSLGPDLVVLPSSWRVLGFFGIPILVFISMFLIMKSGQPEEFLLRNNIIDMGEVIGLDRQLLIADPKGRLFETLGLGGVIAIVAYFLLIPGKERPIFLSISILAPILIIFNPIIVGVFLSVSKQEVLWRFMYMTPIGLVVGYLLAFLASQGRFRRHTWLNIVAILVLIIPWIPYERAQEVLQQRYSTLREIPQLQDIRLLSDLVKEVSRYEGRDILTDPVTGYVIGAMTENRYTGFKFHRSQDHIDLNKRQYSKDSFAGFKGWLVIINLRDGTDSKNGALSGHWPISTLRTSEYYSQGLVEFLSKNPSHFQLVWERNKIRLYEIAH
jgi:hypothetical protein